MYLLGQTLVDGIILGGIFSLSAVGFSLIFGVLSVVNLAHGMFVVLGGYAALLLRERLGMDPLVAIPLVFAALAILGYGLQVGLIQRVVVGRALVSSMLITFGIALILRNLVATFLTSDVRALNSDLTPSSVQLGQIVVDGARATGLLASLILLVVLALVLGRTRIGRAIRGTAQQGFAASLCGVNVASVYALTFAISAGFAGVSGVIIGLIGPFSPSDEAVWTLNAFVVVVLGGTGSPLGALVGGLVLGLINTLSSQYIGPAFPNIMMFGALLVMLVVRPSGLLGNAFRGTV